jgi:hypothetical protein
MAQNAVTRIQDWQNNMTKKKKKKKIMPVNEDDKKWSFVKYSAKEKPRSKKKILAKNGSDDEEIENVLDEHDI